MATNMNISGNLDVVGQITAGGGVDLLDRYDFYNTLIGGDSYETDLLRVSLTDKYHSANKTRFYNITEENWDSISNKPNQWISKKKELALKKLYG